MPDHVRMHKSQHAQHASTPTKSASETDISRLPSQVFTHSLIDDWSVYFDENAFSNKISSQIWIQRCLEMMRLRMWRRVVSMCSTLAYFLWHHSFLPYFHISAGGWWNGRTRSEKQARSNAARMFFFKHVFFFISAAWNCIDRRGLKKCIATLRACKSVRSIRQTEDCSRNRWEETSHGTQALKHLLHRLFLVITVGQTMCHASVLSPHLAPVGSNPRSTRL